MTSQRSQAKNKSLSARTHNEVKMNNSNYVEQLKRLNVYEELIALGKIPISKINNPSNEKIHYNDTQQQFIETVSDSKKSFCLYKNFTSFLYLFRFSYFKKLQFQNKRKNSKA